GLQVDAQTVLDYVHAHPQLAKTPIILYGQSIGGAVAIDSPIADCRHNHIQITALIIENTFTSLPRLIPTAIPWLGPFSFLCHQKWESYRKAPKLLPSIPVLMLGGARDEVVPRSQMQELWDIIRDRGRDTANKKPSAGSVKGKKEDVPPKIVVDGRNTYIEFPDGMHNDTCVQPGYWPAVAKFVVGLHPKVVSSSPLS
ncbi:hypothetical protein BGY98DRAFT_920862, partial [Russula aff. rugulosa BPL654]